ncbi:MAG: aminotransferase class V-fold PLP-dependent enzyme [Crocinitomicaceae bacterium]|nr:aminotransferase class V-fold PLP-dependent enzyme [Crocinitomicaceae bacterium]
MKDKFLLRPDINYLNHGSFGACPIPVFEEYQRFQRMLETEPLQFMTKTGVEYLDQSKQALADYINCEKEDLIYVTNPSTAMNIVIKNLHLKQGDEVLTTNHEYGAMDRTWRYYCQKSGAKYVQQKISTPLESREQFLEEFWSGLTDKTKVVFLSHITSPTALIFPVDEVCKRAKELGLITIVDGAHAPGHIPLDLNILDVDFYTGACHKWMCSPKGSSFLYADKSVQDMLDPLIISWGYESDNPSESQFQDYHQYQGTRDFSAFLTTPACIKFFKENNWEEEKAKCRAQLKHFYPLVAKELNSTTICQLTDEFLGQICSIPVKTTRPVELKELLYNKYKIEIPVFNNVGPVIYLRISFQPYSSEVDYIDLITALRDIKSTTTLIQ